MMRVPTYYALLDGRRGFILGESDTPDPTTGKDYSQYRRDIYFTDPADERQCFVEILHALALVVRDMLDREAPPQ